MVSIRHGRPYPVPSPLGGARFRCTVPHPKPLRSSPIGRSQSRRTAGPRSLPHPFPTEATMRKALRIFGKILLGLVALILLVVVAGYVVSAMKLRKRYASTPARIVVPTDSASLARGHALATLSGCNGCHARNLGGQMMIEQFPVARLGAPNLTRGRGGAGAAYTDADFERAIRHGVRRDGDPLFIMPSSEYNQFRDEDVAQIIAYVRSVPPVDNTV